MADQSKENHTLPSKRMKITVSKDGPYVATGGIPLIQEEICNDDEGYCRTWRETKRYEMQDEYALCRCGNSKNKPFCDGTHNHISFIGNETAGDESYLRFPNKINGPELELLDHEGLCVHARFCMRAGGIWSLIENSDNPEAKDTAIEEACNCPSGRLIIRDKKTGEPIEPELEKSIVVMEYPAKGEHGPLWVRGGIPIESADGKPYIMRNRVTLCRCGKSGNKPFCDGSHINH